MLTIGVPNEAVEKLSLKTQNPSQRVVVLNWRLFEQLFLQSTRCKKKLG